MRTLHQTLLRTAKRINRQFDDNDFDDQPEVEPADTSCSSCHYSELRGTRLMCMFFNIPCRAACNPERSLCGEFLAESDESGEEQ